MFTAFCPIHGGGAACVAGGGVCMAGVCVLGGEGVGETATEVASTHPTGMRFCLYGDQNDAQLKVRIENILYSKIS